MNALLFAAEFEAPNRWLPEAAEVLWGTIAFVIIIALLWKFAKAPIAASLRARSQRIGKEITDAEKARRDADAEAAQIRDSLANIDEERDRIITGAHEAAERVKADGLVRNDTEVTELEARADADIESMQGRATSELQTQVAAWAAEATERIVVAQLDDGTLERLVEDYIAKVGASS